MDDQLCILTVHAHPDDESSKGAGTIAKYHAAGVHTVLVTCTGGEEGDILNPVMDTPEVRANIGAVRRRELDQAVEVIGYDELVLLGYRDSGMADTPANSNPRAFAARPMDETVERLVAEIRRVRPQVVVTYGDNHEHYPHPDHIRSHEISVAAFAASGDPEAFPAAGEAYQPAKLYYSVWSRARILAMHEKYLELGMESPFDEGWLDRPGNEDKITTSIDLTGFEDVQRLALLAHATQVDPASKYWFGLPPEIMRTIHPYDEYILARSLVDTELPEDDLFSGVRLKTSR
jgi:mycothiol S-conjugate amidase